MSWSSGLIKEILNPNNLIISSELGVVIADKYPKAQHHYLVLPLADIPSIFQLNRSHLPLLEELHLLARNVVEVKGARWTDFQVGFHAEPSMQRLHLHVISTDFVSPTLKTKKHWNSFNTELFVPYEKLFALLEKENCFSRLPKSLRDELLNKPLICNQCEFVGKNLPTLKEHLLQHLQDPERTTTGDKMEKQEVDEKAYFRDELKRKLKDKRNFLIETDRAVVIKADFPKSQYHFRVVAKEELRDITQLTEEHLPLLDHMMELANQIIEQQDHLESRDFRIGFKVHTFWNRLNLHVLSDDFYSMAMKRPRHWNSFHTELFMPFQMVHMLLSLQGSIESISEEKYNELRNQRTLTCNQCEFSTDLLLDLKAHLYQHWQRKEGEREQKKKMENIVRLLDEAKLNDDDHSVLKLDDAATGTAQPTPLLKAEPETKGTPTQNFRVQIQHGSGNDNLMYGPPVNMMNQLNPNNPFRNTPPLNINSLNPAPQHRPNYRARNPNQHRMPGQHGPRAPWNGPRFPPNPNWNPQNFPQQGFNMFAPGPSINQQGPPQYPYQPIGAGGYGPTGPPNSVRPKWVQKTQQKNNQNPNNVEQKPNLQNPNQQIPHQQKPPAQHPTQYARSNQQNRPYKNPQNRQNSNQNNNPNPQNPQNPNKQKYKNKKPANPNQGAQASQPTNNAVPKT
nr:aprataxin-like protein isoform X1 [Drosophila kikkawai]